MSGWMQRIFENCRDNMKDTEEDWQKVFSYLEKLWTPERDADIQECILALERHLKGGIEHDR